MEEILLKKIRNERLTDKESQAFDHWLNEDPKNRKTFNQMKLIFNHRNNQDVGALKDEVWSKIIHQQHKEKESTKTIKLWQRTQHIGRAAAVIFLVVTIGIFSYYQFQLSDDSFSSDVKWIEKVSMTGQKVAVTLPDGTKVRLNSESKLLAPEKFDEQSRAVTLEGEAFFEVTKDPNRPFIIHSGDLTTEVLGTSFNVSAYTDQNNIEVAVATGKVAVKDINNEDSRKELSPGQMIVFNEVSREMLVEEFDWEEKFGWKDDILYFKEKNLEDILQVLSSWYGVEFEMKRSLDMQKRFSGRYNNPTLSSVMDGLSFTYEFEFEIIEHKVIIK